AGAIGQSFGFLGAPAPVFAAAALDSFRARVLHNEMAGRLSFGSTLILTGTMPTPAGALADAAMATYGPPRYPYLPYDKAKPLLEERREETRLRGARNDVFRSIMKEMSAINRSQDSFGAARPVDQKMLEAYMADAIKFYGMKTGKSKPLE